MTGAEIQSLSVQSGRITRFGDVVSMTTTGPPKKTHVNYTNAHQALLSGLCGGFHSSAKGPGHFLLSSWVNSYFLFSSF